MAATSPPSLLDLKNSKEKLRTTKEKAEMVLFHKMHPSKFKEELGFLASEVWVMKI
ncbi:hypothetical protein ACLOJK_038976 [Asimina triloba]